MTEAFRQYFDPCGSLLRRVSRSSNQPPNRPRYPDAHAMMPRRGKEKGILDIFKRRE